MASLDDQGLVSTLSDIGHLFESTWKKPYSTRGVRGMLARYAAAAGMTRPVSPHQLRHFLFTWLKTQGVDDALIQPY
ncbi:MAG: tyrosine-type recombinase/integrase, partial [Dermatophilaceae bacterium]